MNQTVGALLVVLSFGVISACSNSSLGGPADEPPVTNPPMPLPVPIPTPLTESFCEKSSWVAGVTEWCNGHLVYRDYLYDDYGADSGVPSSSPFAGGTLAGTAGEARYPTGAENTADLLRLELWPEGTQMQVEFELNTLYTADQTLAVIAIDTDNNPQTGGGEWPGLGIRSTGWDVIYRFELGDPASNRIIGSFPRPAAPAWTLWAVTAQADGTVMNVAFRGPDEKVELFGAVGLLPTDIGAWWEDHQAAALAAGDITAFQASVCACDLDARSTRGTKILPGLHQRIYTSAYTLPPGEGVSLNGVPGRTNPTNTAGSQQFNFLGKYQPYGFYLPDGPGPHSLQVKLHGLGQTHASLISSPGFQRDFGDAQNRVIVSPLARGVVGFYSDISERDVLEVLDDALANLDVDEDQVTLSGYSMGGYGAQRLAMLYPDRFAALVNWVGPTGDDTNTPLPGNPSAVDVLGQLGAGSFIGNMVDFVGNLRNLPSVHLYSGADELLVHLGHSLTLRDRLRQASGVEHDFYLHPAAEHLTYQLLDQWQKEAGFTANRRRVRNPAHITYRTDESFAYPEYGIVHDSAYWLSQIRARGPGYVDVDVHSFGCGQSEKTLESGDDVGSGPLPLIWLRQFRRVAGEQPLAAENRIEASLGNAATLRLDSSRACLHSGVLSYRVQTDGPVVIEFSDGRRLALSTAGMHEGLL